MSLFQYPTKRNHGLGQFSLEAEVESDMLIELPEAYTNVKLILSFNRKPEYRNYSDVENQTILKLRYWQKKKGISLNLLFYKINAY